MNRDLVLDNSSDVWKIKYIGQEVAFKVSDVH